jgi:hypothetical protein
MIIGQIHNLLRRAATFNRATWLGKQRVPSGELLDRLPGSLALIVGIVGTETTLLEMAF